MIGLNGCEKYLEMMSEFMDGELDEGRRAELSEHINSCQDCFNASMAYKSINEAISDGEVAPPEDLCALVMANIHAAEPAKPAAKKWKFSVRHLGVLAAAMVVLIITVIAAPSMFKKSSDSAEADVKDSAAYNDVMDAGDTASPAEGEDGAPAADADEPDAAAPGGKQEDSSFSGVGDADDTAVTVSFAPLIGTEDNDKSSAVDFTPLPPENETTATPAPSTAPNRPVEDKNVPVMINDYACSAIIVLDPAIAPPDVFDQYTYFSWIEGKDEYRIVSCDLYDELVGALENLGYAYTLDLFNQIESNGWVLLITAVKE